MSVENFIPTIWSENLYQELDKQYVGVKNCNRDYEGEIKEKGNTVRICGLNDVLIMDYEKNCDINVPEEVLANERDLVIDQAKYFNNMIDDVELAQSSPKVMELFLKTAAKGLATEADKYVFSLFSHAEKTITETVTADNIFDTILRARSALYQANVHDSSEIVLEVSPRIAELILKAKIDLCKDNSEMMESGCIGSIAGCKVFVSNHIYTDVGDETYTYKCLMRTKRAITFAEQLSEIEAYRPELRFADAVKGLHLYGAKVVYPQEMVTLSLTVKP